MQSIFLHCGWRCGSTYLWSKFRECRGATAFLEPLSEKLARYSAADILKDVSTAWESRHPQLAAPYAAEYLPLIADAGVPLYETRFALERYFVGREELLQESDYLDSLLTHARDRGSNHCVLGFSRSLGRAGAIKRNFPGYHIVLMRNPVQQWLSCRSYRIDSEQPYFELCHLLILALAQRGSLAAEAAAWLRLPPVPPGSFKEQYKYMRSRFRRLDDELSYRVFLTVYILSYLQALPAADLLVDIDLLGTSYNTISRGIAGRTGLLLDFSDCSLPMHDANGVGIDFERIHAEVFEWLQIRDAQHARTPNDALKTAAWHALTEKMQSSLAQLPSEIAPEPLHRLVRPDEKIPRGLGAKVRHLFTGFRS